MKKLLLPIITIISLVAFSCAAPSGDEANTTDTTVQEETAPEAEEEMNEEEDDLSFMLPSPIQIAAIFNRAGLDFKSELPNAVSNVSNYNTKTSKYLNFGVYSADLAYCVLNDQQQMAIDYVRNVEKMSDEIGMSSVFGTGDLVDRFEKNVGNTDSILTILTEIKRRTDEYLEENAENSKSAIFFAGAYIEGMYIGSKSVHDNEHLAAKLIEQMTILDNIIHALKAQKDDSFDLDGLIAGLTKLENTFNGFASIKALDNDEVTFEEVTLTNEELNTMTTMIGDLRKMVISG